MSAPSRSHPDNVCHYHNLDGFWLHCQQALEHPVVLCLGTDYLSPPREWSLRLTVTFSSSCGPFRASRLAGPAADRRDHGSLKIALMPGAGAPEDQDVPGRMARISCGGPGVSIVGRMTRMSCGTAGHSVAGWMTRIRYAPPFRPSPGRRASQPSANGGDDLAPRQNPQLTALRRLLGRYTSASPRSTRS